MKKAFKSILAATLCLCMIFSCLTTAFAVSKRAETVSANTSISLEDYLMESGKTIAEKSEADFSQDALTAQANSFKPVLVKFINFLSNFLLNKVLLNGISLAIPRTSNVLDIDKLGDDLYGNFYAGNESFIDHAQPGASWSLGYSQKSILPADFGKKLYARGSYVPWWYSTEIYKDEDGNKEDVKVRTVILDDGSGRGKTAFSVIDCIGLANNDVRKIREELADFAKENNIVSLNVSATHTHTGIDSQGVWTKPISTLANNFISSITGLTDVKSGIDSTYLQTIIDQTAASVKEACGSMTQGELYYSTVDVSNYVHDRTPPYSYDGNLYRLMFEPKNKDVKPTIIASFGCHPESASYDWLTTNGSVKLDTKISGDFIYYMEKVINKAGYNFVYIQGDVGTVTSSRDKTDDGLENLSAHDTAIRYGYEMGYITLGMTLTQDECKTLNDRCGDLLGVNTHLGAENYSVWYDGRTPVLNTRVEPVLNIKHKQFLLEIENSVAKVLTKSSLANNLLVYDKDSRKYYTITEIGYMEIGSALKVFLCPGETFNELVLGGAALDGFNYEGLRDMYGENLIVFDLMNDAAGYIEPDNNYVIAGYQYDKENDSLVSDSWALLVSMGKNTASKIVAEFIDLVDNAR